MLSHRGKITTLNYDALNRTTFVGFGTVLGNPNSYESTISYTYDGYDRVLQATDSVAGNITHTYNDLTRTYSETTPQGAVTYTSDLAGRRLTMAVAGQLPVSYSYYDPSNRLKQITQGTAKIGIESRGLTFRS